MFGFFLVDLDLINQQMSYAILKLLFLPIIYTWNRMESTMENTLETYPLFKKIRVVSPVTKTAFISIQAVPMLYWLFPLPNVLNFYGNRDQEPKNQSCGLHGNNLFGHILYLQKLWVASLEIPKESILHPTNPGPKPPRRDNNSILSNSVFHKGASLLWTRFEPGTIPPETPGRGKLKCASDQTVVDVGALGKQVLEISRYSYYYGSNGKDEEQKP
ncbi:hypothetical protein LXL04_028884 [Taraxacum kok-saghyz]